MAIEICSNPIATSFLDKVTSLLQRVVRGSADLQEEAAKSGISTNTETTTKKAIGDGKTTTETVKKSVKTVDHAKQAQFLREVVSPGISGFISGLKDEKLNIGKESIPFAEIEELIGLAFLAFATAGKAPTIELDLAGIPKNQNGGENNPKASQETSGEAIPDELLKLFGGLSEELASIIGGNSKNSNNISEENSNPNNGNGVTAPTSEEASIPTPPKVTENVTKKRRSKKAAE